MPLTESIESLTMKVDKKYNDPQLIEALSIYHSLIDNNVIKPRENQLNRSGSLPEMVKFNV